MTARRAALALGAGRGVFAWWPNEATPARARVEAFTFDLHALATGDDATLAAPLRALRRASADSRELHVALASPWSLPRELALPPMREHEARAVLARDGARHFPSTRTDRVAAARALRPGNAGKPSTWCASDGDGVVLDAIIAAARAAGFSAVRCVPAVGAWAHAAGTATQRVFVVDDEAAVLDARNGLLTRLRRCRAAECGAQSAATDDALPLAAQHAPWCAERELVSVATQTERSARAGTLSRRLVTASVLALAAALALRVWGSSHRVARIEAQRAALRPAIAPLLAARDSLAQITDALDELSRTSAQSPAWTQRLWSLSSALPRDAQFTSWRGEGDSVVVEGRADDPSAVLQRLRTARNVSSVRTLAPIGEAGTDGASFALVVRFTSGATP
ncbi:MAG: hypothetical protein NTW72_13030 [Gemmatimonadetes bacterium]|nr:hypothetical protein [Gemmatimonadota bacterium]